MSISEAKRVLIILYAGDYYEAYNRMISGLGETYRHHFYALRAIADFAKQDGVEEVAVLGCATQNAYNHFLDSGFRVMGAGLDPYQNPKQILKIIAEFNPTHIVLRAPIPPILKWSINHNVKTITLLADSFFNKNFKTWYRNFEMARLLNYPIVEWVGNHHINSCLSLQKIGVAPDKIVPWDWPYTDDTTETMTPKTLPRDRKQYTFTYVGSIAEAKGVGDLLQAMAILRGKGVNATLKIAGRKDQAEPFMAQAKALGITANVEFLGMVPNDQVIHLMRESDIVFVPSRHSYPEGLPMTINEALASRTPILASDHPTFLSNIQDGFSALIFPEKNPEAIAQRVETLLENPDLYAQLSANAGEALERMKIPMIWGDFISRWIEETPESYQWIQQHALTSKVYESRLEVA